MFKASARVLCPFRSAGVLNGNASVSCDAHHVHVLYESAFSARVKSNFLHISVGNVICVPFVLTE